MKSTMLMLATVLVAGCAQQHATTLQDNIEYETSFASKAVMERPLKSEIVSVRTFQVAKNKAVNLISFYTNNGQYCAQFVSGISLTTINEGQRQIATAIVNDHCEAFDPKPTLDTLNNYVLKPHFTRLKAIEPKTFLEGLSYELLVF